MQNNLKQYSDAELNQLKAQLEMVTKKEFVENELKAVTEELARREELKKPQYKEESGTLYAGKPMDGIGIRPSKNGTYKQEHPNMTSYYHVYGTLHGKLQVEVVRTSKSGLTTIYTTSVTPDDFTNPKGTVKAPITPITYSEYQEAYNKATTAIQERQEAIEKEMQHFHDMFFPRSLFAFPFFPMLGF